MRIEDYRFVSGQGRYTANLLPDGALHAYVLRSSVSHANIVRIDCAVAAEMPGVVAIYTGSDVAHLGPLASYVEMTGSDGRRYIEPFRPVLALDAVKYVGEPIALIVAESLHQARDAAELVEIEYDYLPSVVDVRAATAPDAPLVWDEAPGNRSMVWEIGDSDAVANAFSQAAHISSLGTRNNRLVAAAVENRAALSIHDESSDQTTLYTPSQGVHFLRNLLSDHVFKEPREKIRVVTNDVGGAFGPKYYLYHEHALLIWAARNTRRSVFWCADRSETFFAEAHARDQWTDAQIALDQEGRIIGLRLRGLANMGAYISSYAPSIPTTGMAKVASGLYEIPSIHVEMHCVFTNTVPVDAYRGAGKPETCFVLERLIDIAAGELGVSPVELRRKNLVAAERMPYRTALGYSYDSGNFPALFETGLKNADLEGYTDRLSASSQKGLCRGFGLSGYVHGTGGLSDEQSRVVLELDGQITVYTGTQSSGQGHETAFAQVAANMLKMGPAKVRLRQGDTDYSSAGGGTGGSSSAIVSATTIYVATERLLEKIKLLGAHFLEAAPADIIVEDEFARVSGTDRRIQLSEIAGRAQSADTPEALRGPPKGEASFADNILSFPSGVITCEVEVDPETGTVKIDRLSAVQDVGAILNQTIVDGQMHGGIGQGIGQALLESIVFDEESGQLVTGSFMDYGLPRADDIPNMKLESLSEQSPNNRLGIKGVGELGNIGAPPAIVNAIVDALSRFGVRHIDMPASPARVWGAIQEARSGN